MQHCWKSVIPICFSGKKVRAQMLKGVGKVNDSQALDHEKVLMQRFSMHDFKHAFEYLVALTNKRLNLGNVI